MSAARHPLALRIPQDKLDAIDARAKSAGLSRTEYIVRASLGETTSPSEADSRLTDVEKRLDRVERLIELGA